MASHSSSQFNRPQWEKVSRNLLDNAFPEGDLKPPTNPLRQLLLHGGQHTMTPEGRELFHQALEQIVLGHKIEVSFYPTACRKIEYRFRREKDAIVAEIIDIQK